MSWIGRVVSFGEARLNRADLPVEERRNRGMFLVAAVLILVLVLSVSLAAALSDTIAGFAVMALCASTLLAQRSLYKHVRSVADALARSVADGRAALSRIADRDVDRLTKPAWRGRRSRLWRKISRSASSAGARARAVRPAGRGALHGRQHDRRRHRASHAALSISAGPRCGSTTR